MEHKKGCACRFDLSVRRIGQTGQALLRIIKDNLSHYMDIAFVVDETSMHSRGEP